MSEVRKRIVVIGGGFAGAYIAKQLERKHAVTLIDTKDYFEFTPGILRTLVEPEHAGKIQALHEHHLTCARFIRGAVTKITKKYVYIDKQKIEYDYLALATGCRYNRPFKQRNVISAERGRILRNHHESMRDANSLLVIGGGPVGIELAAEIAQKYPQKRVTIVHSRDALLPRSCPSVQNAVMRWLRKHDVQMVLAERVQDAKDDIFITNKGTQIKADAAFLCTGIKPNTEYLQTSFPHLVDDKTYVLVDEHLRLQGYDNVFVGGDLVSIKEEKLAQTAEKHAEIIVENIRRTLAKKPLLTYVSQSRPMLISLGKYYGVLTYKNVCLKGIIPAILKWFVEWRTMIRYR